MFSRLLTVACAAAVLTACTSGPSQTQAKTGMTPAQSAQQAKAEFEQSDMVQAISQHLGVTSESAASAIEKIFADEGRPNAYITGEEGGGAIVGGAFWGKGTIWMKDGRSQPIFWTGPTIGFDTGADASKVFTLVYGADDPNYVYQRFPKAEGNAFLVAGMAVNYQRANGITLAPVRTGVGIRLGASIGYSSYSKKRKWIPL